MSRCSGGEPNRAENGDVKLSYGEAPDGRMRHISLVPSGLTCGCVCPACKERLVARKGQRAHHFAHYTNRACRTAYETMLHRLAKQVIADRKVVRTPAVIAEHLGKKRLVRRETDFRLDEVDLEQWLDGMRPDIIARRTVDGVARELLVEIKVTHPCGPEKVALVCKRRIATIEIDLSEVPRHASQQEMEDAILSAPRKWLFNALEEAGVEEMRLEAERREAEARQQEERRRQREETKLKVSVDRLVAVFCRMRAAGQRQTEHGGVHLARVRDAGLAEHVGLVITGSACFAVPLEEWQAAIVDGFVIGKDVWYATGFRTAAVVDFLRERRFVLPDFPMTVSEALGAAVRAITPHFRSPSEAVESYLGLLGRRRVLRRDGHDWCRDQGVSQKARERIRQAIKGRSRAADLAEKIRNMLAVIPRGHCIDVESWMGTAHPTLADTPQAIATAGGWEYPKLLGHLDRLMAMLEPGAALEENLLGLPLEQQLEARSKEHRLAKEQRAQQAAEAARKAAEDERRAAEWRKKTVARQAVALLGDEDGAAWLAQRSSSLGGVPFHDVDRITKAQYDTLSDDLSAEYTQRVFEAARQAAIREFQESLRTEAADHGDPDWVNFWMRAQNRLLHGSRPVEVCVDQAGLARCKVALRQEPRRLRRA